MDNPLEEVRDIIKQEVAQAQLGVEDNATLNELIDDRVKSYLDTLSDRLVDQNTNEKSFRSVPVRKLEGKSGFEIELITKSIDQTASVPGSGEAGITPWFKLGRGNPFMDLITIEEIPDGLGAFKTVKVSEGKWEKRAQVSDTLTAGGKVEARNVTIDEFNCKISGTKSAIEDVWMLPNAVRDYILDLWNARVGESVVSSLVSTASDGVKTGITATNSKNGIPAKADIISKLAGLISSLNSEYHKGAVLIVSRSIYEVLLDALATTSVGGFRYDPMSDELYFPGGHQVVQTSHLETATKATDVVALCGNLQYSTVLGLRRNLDIRFAESQDDPAVVHWLGRTRYAVAGQDPSALVKMVASA